MGTNHDIIPAAEPIKDLKQKLIRPLMHIYYVNDKLIFPCFQVPESYVQTYRSCIKQNIYLVILYSANIVLACER